MYRSTHIIFFARTHLCIRVEPQLVHTCLHKMYLQVFFEQVVLRVLAELIVRKIMCIACVGIITTHDFPLSLNRPVL